MRITRVTCILTAPAGIGLAVVKVETSEPGLHGLGCATFTQRLSAVRTVVDEYLAPLLVGRDPGRIEDLWQLVHQNAYWRNGPVLNNALSGVDQALWDIKGKLAGMPLFDLLGGRVRDGAAAYAHADGRDPEEVADAVLRLRDAGYRHVRCQMGGYGGAGTSRRSGAGPAGTAASSGVTFDPARYASDVPRMFETVRSRVGWELELLHDVHERIPPIAAVRLARDLDPYRLFFLEDPVAPEDQAWLAEIRAHSTTPIALGELFVHPMEWRGPIVDRRIDFIRVHVSTIGGITPARKLAALADAFGVRTAFHGPGDVSPVGHAANVHLDLALPNFGIQEWTPLNEALQEVFPGAPQLRDGFLEPSTAPGLGVEIDEAAAARYPVSGDAGQFRGGVVEWTQTRRPDGGLTWP